MNGYDSEARRRIRKAVREAQEALTDQQVFASSMFQRHLTQLAASMIGKNPPTVHLYDHGADGGTAWTDKRTININWSNRIISGFPTLEQRLMALVGMFFHEVAHVMFLDFDEEQRADEFIARGIPYGSPDMTGASPEEQKIWSEISAALANPNARQVFRYVFHTVANHANDVHDEAAIIKRYGAYTGEGISLCASSLQADCPVYEEMVDGGNYEPLAIAFNLQLQMLRFGMALAQDQSAMENGPYSRRGRGRGLCL